jgi:thiosulfate/3-mercaptopyruvate sulfurtransferase
MQGGRNVGFLRTFILSIATWALMVACSSSGEQPDATMDSLVTAEWLSQHLDDPNLVVLDCTVMVEMLEDGGVRVVSGQSHYKSGHIPTAGFADLMGDLSDNESPFQFAVPTPEQFASAMSALGVGDDSRVVLYDASNSGWAARVWWMLRWVGFDRAALLDGGLAAWNELGRPLSTEPASRAASHLTVALRPELIADRDEVFASIENDAVSLIDAMPAAHYSGEMVMYDRPGHIPGALNVPASSLFDDSGRFRSNDELASMIESDRNARSITYCGGGISASADAFILTRLGFTDVAVYAASLQEWAADPANPMKTASSQDRISQ